MEYCTLHVRPCVVFSSKFTQWTNKINSRGHILKSTQIINTLSNDIVSASDIRPCNKLLVYRVIARQCNAMTSVVTFIKRWQNPDVFTPINAIFK